MCGHNITVSMTFLATAGRGSISPVRDADDAGAATTETVCDVIASLERSSPSLDKGVMAVAADDADVPRGFLRTLQARGRQPVYTIDVGSLLADSLADEKTDAGRSDGTKPTDKSGADGKKSGTDGEKSGDDGKKSTAGGNERPPPKACERPASADRRGLLPVRSRYVVLFCGAAGPTGPFAELLGLDHSFWDANVYYVFVVREFDRVVRQTVFGVWRDLSIYKTIVVTPNAVRLLDPFVHNADNGWFTTVPLRSLDRIPRVLRSRTRNLRRFPLRFVINYRTPTVVASPDHGGFVGQDGTFAAVLAASMNATPVYGIETSANGKISYGYREARDNRSSYGTFGAVVDGRADVSVNGHFLKDYGCYLAELTRHITSDKVCLLTPKSGVIPPMMTVLMSFQREVWTMTAVTCILVTLIYYAETALSTRSERPQLTGCGLGLEIYRMFIGAPTNRIFAHSCQRLLTSFCLIFTLVILNAFQGSLVTFLSTPMHYPDINTFADLKGSNLPIRTSSISFKEILTGDPNLKSLANRLEKWANEVDIHNSDGRFAGFQRVNVFSLEHFKDVLYVANRNNTRVLHTMHECLISYFISYVVHRNSPYKRRINTVLSRIDQAGLVIKWNSDVSKYIFDKYKPINPKDYETSKVFSVRDLEIAFIVFWFGTVLSAIVFAVELLSYRKPKTQPPRTSHYSFLH